MTGIVPALVHDASVQLPRSWRTTAELTRHASRMATLAPARPLVAFTAPPTTLPQPGTIEYAIVKAKAETVMRDVALTIPAVRRAVHVIAGTISTFGLGAWIGTTRVPGPEWLGQPDAKRPLFHTLYRLVNDLIWHDTAYLKITRTIAGEVKYLSHVTHSRVTAVKDPYDADAPGGTLLDGRRSELLAFDGGGIGGLQRFGAPLLQLYMSLQDAAGNYALNPTPSGILHNTADDELNQDEIDELLATWMSLRAARSVAYLNNSLQYESPGWSARELQLVEGREHAALEVARAFGLPARSLNAATNDSMSYSNDTAARRDLLEALRPWLTVVEQTFSLNDRSGVLSGYVVPRGMTIRFDATAYTRDDPTTRMNYWAVALSNNILTIEQVQAQEPLAW